MVKENTEGEFQVFTKIEYAVIPELTIRINQERNGESNTVYLQGGLLVDFFAAYAEALNEAEEDKLRRSAEGGEVGEVAPFPVPEDQNKEERKEPQEGPVDTTQQNTEN